MNICLTGNCQIAGIATFLRLSPNAAKYRISEIPHLVQFYQGLDPKAHPELPVAEQERMMREADVILYHAKGGNEPDLLHLNDTAVKLPLTVVYNGAYFMQCWEDKTDWEPVLRVARDVSVDQAVRFAVDEHDFGYHRRWADHFGMMVQKEHFENVPSDTWASDVFLRHHIKTQPLITNNHPTSIIFADWTDRILAHLGEPTLLPSVHARARTDRNMAGLPCEFSAGSGARRHLGLEWGARAEDQVSCAKIARERITKWLNE